MAALSSSSLQTAWQSLALFPRCCSVFGWGRWRTTGAITVLAPSEASACDARHAAEQNGADARCARREKRHKLSDTKWERLHRFRHRSCLGSVHEGRPLRAPLISRVSAKSARGSRARPSRIARLRACVEIAYPPGAPAVEKLEVAGPVGPRNRGIDQGRRLCRRGPQCPLATTLDINGPWFWQSYVTA